MLKQERKQWLGISSIFTVAVKAKPISQVIVAKAKKLSAEKEPRSLQQLVD